MAKYNMFRISEANKALEEQDAKIVALTGQLEAAVKASELNVEEATKALQEQLSQKVTALETAEAQVTELSQFKATAEKLQLTIESHAKELATLKESVAKQAAAKAGEIVAAQGIPPISTETPEPKQPKQDLHGRARVAAAWNEKYSK